MIVLYPGPSIIDHARTYARNHGREGQELRLRLKANSAEIGVLILKAASLPQSSPYPPPSAPIVPV